MKNIKCKDFTLSYITPAIKKSNCVPFKQMIAISQAMKTLRPLSVAKPFESLRNDTAKKYTNDLHRELKELRTLKLAEKVLTVTLKFQDNGIQVNKEIYCADPSITYIYRQAKAIRRAFIHERRVNSRMMIEELCVKGSIETDDGRPLELKTVANCFQIPESILMAQKIKNQSSVWKQKVKPKTSDNYVGLELEFFSNSDNNDLGRKLMTAGLGEYCYLREDGSIEPEDDMIAHEVNILVKETEYESVVKRVCAVLAADDASVNDSCGFHAHFDMRNRDRRKCFSNLVAAQNILFAMQPKTRRNSSYCQRTPGRDFDHVEGMSKRYMGINAQAFKKMATLEVRIHSGTVQAEKINNWVKLILQVVNQAEEVESVPRKLYMFTKQFGIVDTSLIEYMSARIKKFAGKEELECA